jgi:hypothetical protein
MKFSDCGILATEQDVFKEQVFIFFLLSYWYF